MNSRNLIQIFLCGGTIDKSYNPVKEIFEFRKTHINEMLELARIPELEIKTKELFLKDSLDITDEDREILAKACSQAEAKKIIIMHGTSKMVESAKYIVNKAQDEIKGKTIVLFGALYPYEHRKTEAMFNLGAALIASYLLEPNVYIVMNGRVFFHDKVKKNIEEAHFVGEDYKK